MVTGLGNDSITSRFPYFSVFDFEHPFVERIRSVLEYMQDICTITKTNWHSHLYAQSWFNVMRNGQKINFHSHGMNEDILYGFHITIETQNTSTIYHNPFDTKQIIEVPNDIGTITLFPNYIPHQTTTYEGNDVRISIAGDITESSSVPKKITVFTEHWSIMTTFIDEFQISDLTLCDSLLQLYNDAHDRGMTFAVNQVLWVKQDQKCKH